jgi:alpha-mannosidase
MPDPMADVGEHEFKYSLYPHTGSWNEETQREAYLLNDPIVVYQRKEERGKKSERSLQSLVSTSSPNVIIETVKRAENGDGIIVRLYESQRKRGPVQVHTGFGLEAAWEINLLEENQSALRVENNSVPLSLRPFQIVTLRLIPRRE